MRNAKWIVWTLGAAATVGFAAAAVQAASRAGVVTVAAPAATRLDPIAIVTVPAVTTVTPAAASPSLVSVPLEARPMTPIPTRSPARPTPIVIIIR